MNTSSARVLDVGCLNAAAVINFCITFISYLILGHTILFQIIPKSLLVSFITFFMGWIVEIVGKETSNQDVYEAVGIIFDVVTIALNLVIMMGRIVAKAWIGSFIGLAILAAILVVVGMCIFVNSGYWPKSAKAIKNFFKEAKVRKAEKKEKIRLIKEKEKELNHNRFVDC